MSRIIDLFKSTSHPIILVILHAWCRAFGCAEDVAVVEKDLTGDEIYCPVRMRLDWVKKVACLGFFSIIGMLHITRTELEVGELLQRTLFFV